MTERVVLHVGGPKSGTTYLQGVLRAEADRFARQGVLVLGRAQHELVHAAMALRDDRRLDSLPPRAREAWDRVVAEVDGWDGETAVASYELFSNLTTEQVDRALADLGDREVHVVVTARDLGRATVSAWQERLKFGLAEPLEQWRPPAEGRATSEWGWRTLDPASVATRWGARLEPSRVHVVTVPRSGGAEQLWQRFAAACGLEGMVPDPGTTRANESLDVAAAEVLRRVNPHLDEVLPTARDRAVWSRDLLANRVLARLGTESLTPTPELLEEARERYLACAATITERGWTVHGDLTDLEPGQEPGRLPTDVGEAEYADVATRALALLLAEVRADAIDRGSPQTPRAGAGAASTPARDRAAGSARAAVGALRSAVAGRRGRRPQPGPESDRVAELHARIDEVEALLDDRRRLHQRLAMLTDLVAHLLEPIQGASAARHDELIDEYRRLTT